jgi:hypothetical protein
MDTIPETPENDDEIINLIDTLLKNNTFYFRNVIDFILFISRVNKIAKNEILSSDNKVAMLRKIGQTAVDELEIRGLVTFELAYEIRLMLDNTKDFEPIFNNFLKFFT